MIYKVLDANGSSFNGGKAVWRLPTQDENGAWTPGEWMPEIEGALVPCENGYHLCEDAQVVEWLGPAIYEAEYDGEVVKKSDKVVVRRVRLLRRIVGWNDDTAQQLARWCDLSVAHLWNCPAIMREYLKTGDESIRDAAWAAAAAAARAAAAWAAVWAAAAAAAADAARDAARDAAWGAAVAAKAAQYEQFLKLTVSGEA